MESGKEKKIEMALRPANRQCLPLNYPELHSDAQYDSAPFYFQILVPVLLLSSVTCKCFFFFGIFPDSTFRHQERVSTLLLVLLAPWVS